MMPPDPISIALVGYGKIAADSHVPAIHGNPDFQLVACVSVRGAGPEGVPVFRDLAELLASGIACDAVAHCNTPAAREDSVITALAAGKHCLLEKPPAADLAAWARISAAQQSGVTLMTAWHSQANAAVTAARAWLADKRIINVALDWREDVRKWHPGQEWIWDAGGFGVFDPGINGLSIASAILPFALEVESARLDIPANRAMPIAAALTLGARGWDGRMHARFDWRETTGECWRIAVETDGGSLLLDDGGRRLAIDGRLIEAHGNAEYPALYRQFADLARNRQSHVDISPLMLVCDALDKGERHSVAPFFDDG